MSLENIIDAHHASRNGVGMWPEVVTADPMEHDRADLLGDQDEAMDAAAGNSAHSGRDRGGDADGASEVPPITEAHLLNMLPPEPIVPSDQEVKELVDRLIQQDLGQGLKISHGLERYLLKMSHLLQRRREQRDRIFARLQADLGIYLKKWAPLRITLRAIKDRIVDETDKRDVQIAQFKTTLSDGGFDPAVTPDIAGTEVTMRRKAELELEAGAAVEAGKAGKSETLVGESQPTEPDYTPLVSGAGQDQIDGEEKVEDAIPVETPLASPEAVTTEPGILPKPVKPTPMPMPAKPTLEGGKGFHGAGFLELAVSFCLACILGSIFGAAIANGLGIASTRDLIEFRSVAGIFFTLVLGPILLLLAGEGYKEITKEIVQLGHPQATRNRHSNFAIWTLLAVLVLFSVADISATANLFRQAAADNVTDIWGKGADTPLWVFWIEGLLVSTPLMVYKVILGRKRGLAGCHAWERYQDEVQRVEEANKSAQDAYEAELTQWTTERKRQDEEHLNQASERKAMERKLREQHEQEMVKAAQAETLKQEWIRRCETMIAFWRQNNKAIKAARGIAIEIGQTQIELNRWTENEKKVRADIAQLDGTLALTPVERRQLAEMDMAIMCALNEIYIDLYGMPYYDADALHTVTTVPGAPMVENVEV